MSMSVKIQSAVKSAWLHCPRPVAAPRLRLFCFPYAGGVGSIFHHWPAALPADVEVWALTLPGRGFRLREAPVKRMQPLIQEITREIAPLLDRPVALFGHSLGAVVAWEMAHVLAKTETVTLLRLFVSGKGAPQLVPNSPPLHLLGEEELLARLRDYNGMPEVVIQNPEVRELVVPSLRADLELLETWEYSERPPLEIPIAAFGGVQDVLIPQAVLDAWGEQTRGAFESHMLPGGHLFIDTHSAPLLEQVARHLSTNE
jgi:medium-chain acyl-[acyl-carrier-protein] hydrolase